MLTMLKIIKKNCKPTSMTLCGCMLTVGLGHVFPCQVIGL